MVCQYGIAARETRSNSSHGSKTLCGPETLLGAWDNESRVPAIIYAPQNCPAWSRYNRIELFIGQEDCKGVEYRWRG